MASQNTPKSVKLPKKRLTQQVRCVRRPNRGGPRPFTAQQIGKLVCRYLADKHRTVVTVVDPDDTKTNTENVVLRKSLRAEVEKCLPCQEDQPDLDQAAAAEAVAVAAEDSLTNTNAVLLVAASVLAALLVIPRAFSLLPAGLAVAVPVGARLAITQIAPMLTRIRAQRAANDALIGVLKTFRRAANG